jgi:hypothetical protein
MLVNPSPRKKGHPKKRKIAKIKNPKRNAIISKVPFAKELGLAPAKKRRMKERRRNPQSPAKAIARSCSKLAKRRNPIGFGTVETALLGTAGAIATQGITSWILKDKNKDIIGYLGNLIAAAGLGFVLELTLGNKIGESVAAGGFIGTGIRFYSDKIQPRVAAATVSRYALPGQQSKASPALPPANLSRYAAIPAPAVSAARPPAAAPVVTNKGGGRIVSIPASGLSGTASSHKQMWDN